MAAAAAPTVAAQSRRLGRSGALVWYRVTDLRTRDHEPLFRAHQAHDSVLHVAILDPRQWAARTAWGSPTLPSTAWPKIGHVRAKFLLESVAALREEIHALGAAAKQRLFVRVGEPEVVLPALASAVGRSSGGAPPTVYCHQGESTEELEVESGVRAALSDSAAGSLVSLHGNTLYDLRDLPFDPASREFPPTSSNFRTSCEKRSRIREPLPTPPSPRPPPAVELSDGDVPTLEQIGVVPDKDAAAAQRDPAAPPAAAASAALFRGGAAAAHARLRTYFWDADALRTYFATRNGLLGTEYSSKLSPWLSAGCISPREVAAEVRRYERERVKNKDTYWLIFELTVRDYFRYYAMHYGATLFFRDGAKGVDTRWGTDLALFDTWRLGKTGNPMIDANMRELLATGFMSNRGRQIVASYLVRDMGLDWRLGAMWFESQLVDHDVASNYGNWQYGAGVGSDPREDRYFNISTQTKRYDPEMRYVRHWCAETVMLPDASVLALLKAGCRGTRPGTGRLNKNGQAQQQQQQRKGGKRRQRKKLGKGGRSADGRDEQQGRDEQRRGLLFG